MKTKFKKFSISLGIALIAIAGAFASKVSAENNARLIDREGYYLNEDDVCTPSGITCSTVFNTQMCSTAGHAVLFDWNGTSCAVPLYYKPQ